MKSKTHKEEDIDIREYLGVVFKRKKIIVGIVILSLLISVLISYMTPKIYEAKASLLVTPANIEIELSPVMKMAMNITDGGTEGAYITSRPVVSLAIHQVLARSSIVLSRVAKRLKMVQPTHGEIKLPSLAHMLSIKRGNAPGVLLMFAENPDARFATEMINIWATEYMRFHQEIVSGKDIDVSDLITSDEITDSSQAASEQQARINHESAYTIAQQIVKRRAMKVAQLGDVTLISPAIEPVSPLQANRRETIVLGGIIGFVLAIFIAFLWEYMHKSKVQ